MFGHVAFDVGVFAVDHAQCSGLTREAVVFLGDADFVGGLFDDGQEFGADLVAAGLAQVLGGGVIAAAENRLGVRHAHFLHGIDQQRLGLRHRCLGRLVHAGLQLVDLRAHTELLHLLRHFAQAARQFDAHVLVVTETAWNTQLLDGHLRALGQGVLEAAGGVGLRQVAQGKGKHVGRQQQARTQAGKGNGGAEHGNILFEGKMERE